MFHTTSKGVELQLTPVNKMLLLPLRDKFPAARKPAPPVDQTEIGPVENTDSPEYDAQLQQWAEEQQDLMQDVYFEFGVEDFDFDQSKVDGLRRKWAKLFPDTKLPTSDKRLFIQYFACAGETEYVNLFNQIVTLTEPSPELLAQSREMFSGSVPG